MFPFRGLLLGRCQGTVNRESQVQFVRGFVHEYRGNTGRDPEALLGGIGDACLDRILEVEDETASVEAMRRMADETFQILDVMEAEDAANQGRSGNWLRKNFEPCVRS